MRLNPAEIRSISTGILDLKTDGSNVRLLRMTDAQRAMYPEDNVGWMRAQTMAGVTLDFRTDSRTLTLACSDICLNPNYHCAFDVFIDGAFYTSFSMAITKPDDVPALPSGFRHTFPLPEGEKRITLYFPLYTMQIDAVELDDGAHFAPCSRRWKWVVFGDSISEGREPDHPCNSYVCRCWMQRSIIRLSVARFSVPGSFCPAAIPSVTLSAWPTAPTISANRNRSC